MSKQKKFVKNVLVTMCVASLLVSTNAIATSSRLSKTFTKKKVDSNEYRKVAEITKKQEYEYGYVTIDEIYKADGSSSHYKKIKAKVYCKPDKKWISCESGKVIKKKKEKRFLIPKSGRKSGVKLRFSAKGNDPALDCRVSGHFDTY